MRMNITGGIFILIGLCVGVVGMITSFTSDGSLGCIISIMAMLGGVLLLQLAQGQGVVAPIEESYTAEETATSLKS
jgi:hypothetical protein